VNSKVRRFGNNAAENASLPCWHGFVHLFSGAQLLQPQVAEKNFEVKI
jgi:hypothetical protein